MVVWARDREDLNLIFLICNQNVKPFTTCPYCCVFYIIESKMYQKDIIDEKRIKATKNERV